MSKASTILSNYESSQYLDITVDNREFRRNGVAFAACLALLLAVYGLVFSHIQSYSLHSVFFILIFFSASAIANLVRRECIKIVKSVGVFHVRQSLLSQKSLFIPYENISNVVVNEVISYNRVSFVVQILCKQTIFAADSRTLNLVINGNFSYSVRS